MTNDAALTLANCLEAIERHELTLDQYLARHPDQHRLLTELVPLAQHLRAAPMITPSLDFRADARRQLISQLSPRRSSRAGTLTRNWARVIPSAARNLRARLTDRVVNTEIPRRRSHSATLRGPSSMAPRNDAVRIEGLRLVRALAVLIILVVLGSSAVVASAQSLPNEVLYPVKIAIEQVRLALSPDQLTRGELSLNFADERLNEVQRLIDRGEGTKAAGTLDAFAEQIQSAAELVHGSPSSAERETLLVRLQISIDRSDEMLVNSEGQLPSSARPAIQRAHAALRAVPPQSPPAVSPTSTLTPTPTPTSTDRPEPPTRAPRPTATPQPGVLPTLRPTRAAPTTAPTATTHWPTFEPTHWPIGLPTLWATLVPTQWLTPIATWHPTFVPPTLPTRSPLATPGWPTSWPTHQPNATPPPPAFPTWPLHGSPHPTVVWPTPRR